MIGQPFRVTVGGVQGTVRALLWEWEEEEPACDDSPGQPARAVLRVLSIEPDVGAPIHVDTPAAQPWTYAAELAATARILDGREVDAYPHHLDDDTEELMEAP